MPGVGVYQGEATHNSCSRYESIGHINTLAGFSQRSVDFGGLVFNLSIWVDDFVSRQEVPVEVLNGTWVSSSV